MPNQKRPVLSLTLVVGSKCNSEFRDTFIPKQPLIRPYHVAKSVDVSMVCILPVEPHEAVEEVSRIGNV